MSNTSWLDVSPYRYLTIRPLSCFSALKVSAEVVVLCFQQEQPDDLTVLSMVPFFGPLELYTAQMTLLSSVTRQPPLQKQNRHKK